MSFFGAQDEVCSGTNYMGESFQEYPWIQDFEADFP